MQEVSKGTFIRIQVDQTKNGDGLRKALQTLGKIHSEKAGELFLENQSKSDDAACLGRILRLRRN